MSPTELAAATAMYHSLTVLPCTCRHVWPYNVDKGVLLHHCHRCKALARWDQVVEAYKENPDA